MFKEFKTFIARGNVLDLAVAVIIGAAFGKIVTALTDDIIMPVVGTLTGGLDFSSYFLVLGKIPAALAGSSDYAALKKAGIESKLIAFEGEGHLLAKRENGETFIKESIEFFKRHLAP